MEENKSFVALGYTGIWDYCHRKLKLSEAQSAYYAKVARKCIEVPQLKDAIENGDVSLSKGRRISGVITVENAGEWIEKAKVLPQRELEREVTAVNPRANPKPVIKPIAPTRSELRLGISKELEEKFRKAADVLGKTLEETLEAAVECLLEKKDPERKAARAEKRAARPVKQTQKPGVRQPIPAAYKHQTVLRTGNQCCYRDKQGNRCTNHRYLEYHHIIPVSLGGTNDPENLTLLCGAHHKSTHWMKHPSSQRKWQAA